MVEILNLTDAALSSPSLSVFGMPFWVFLILMAWDTAWKLVGMWRAARGKSVPWFLALGLINTVGILPILYIFVFSKIGKKKNK